MTFSFQTVLCGGAGDFFCVFGVLGEYYESTVSIVCINQLNFLPGWHLPTESERLWRCQDANVLQLQGFFFVGKW